MLRNSRAGGDAGREGAAALWRVHIGICRLSNGISVAGPCVDPDLNRGIPISVLRRSQGERAHVGASGRSVAFRLERALLVVAANAQCMGGGGAVRCGGGRARVRCGCDPRVRGRCRGGVILRPLEQSQGERPDDEAQPVCRSDRRVRIGGHREDRAGRVGDDHGRSFVDSRREIFAEKALQRDICKGTSVI